MSFPKDSGRTKTLALRSAALPWWKKRTPAASVFPILLALLLPWPARAAVPLVEPGSYRIDHWQPEDGLPQSSVTSILQTRDGYLWLATFGGLARFDGVQFRVFDLNTSPGLPSQRILALYEDRDGALWIGTEEGDVIRCAGGRFDVYTPPNQGGLIRHPLSFAQTPDGTLWICTAENLLLRFADGKFTIASANWNLKGTQVSSVTLDVAGQLWIGTDEELARLEDGHFVAVWDGTREAGFSVDALGASHSGGCWVAGNGRLRRFEKNIQHPTSSIQHPTEDRNDEHRKEWVADYGAYPWSKGIPQCLHEDRHGQVWIGTYGSGLFRYATNGAVLNLSRQDGLPADAVRSLHEDREGNIWVGFEGRGLARLKTIAFRSYARRHGLSGDSILSICEGAGGELWIGTNGDGVNLLKDGMVQHFGAAEGLVNECVWSVFQDRNKTVWAGTWGGGLFKLDGENFVPVENTGGIVVCGLFEDSRGDLWLGQQVSSPSITQLRQGWPAALPLPGTLSHANVRVITEDRAGHVWIGTLDDGLYRAKDGEVVRFGKGDGLSSERIRALYADAEGVLWIGTSLGGLNRFHGGRFTAFTTREGMADDTILHIVEDHLGNLWCSSGGAGVLRVNKEALNQFARDRAGAIRCFTYDKGDGLPSMELSGGCQPAGCKTRDGRLWFATVNGVAVADPDRVPFNTLPPPVVIEALVVEGMAQNLIPFPPEAQAPAGITRPAPTAGSLKIPPGKHRFEIRYTGLSFTAPEKVRFQYKLEGWEKEWVDAGGQRTAIYSYLQPGNYRFRVMASNNDGVWNEDGATLAIIILPHFWQTWWFRGLMAGVVVLLFVAAYEVRLASERRLALERLRIARDLHDEVGSNLGSIALLSEMASQHPQGLHEEISEIRRVAVQTIDSLRDIVSLLDPADDTMHDVLLRMKEAARILLPGIPFDFQIEGAVEGTAPSLEFRRNLFRLFKEVLHNVAKHARATHVGITITITTRRFHLRVSDDGIGFDEATVRPGNGLKNLRQRAADIGGALEIRSQPGAGTTVTLSMPRAHLST